MRISDWSSDVCSSDLRRPAPTAAREQIISVESSAVAAQRLRPQSAQQRMHFARRLPQQAAEAARIVEAQHPAAAAARPRERDVEVVVDTHRSEEHTSELQSLMRNSYAVFCLKKKKNET